MKKTITKKQRELFLNIISIIFVATIIYGFLSFLLQYKLSINAFISSADFTTIMILGILLYVLHDIISGKKKFRPKQPQKTKPKSKPKPEPSPEPDARGTSKCPKCHHMMIGDHCSRCRITWR